MKVTATRENENFKPIELTLTIESEDQLKAVFCLFNHSVLCLFLEARGIEPTRVRGALKGAVEGGVNYCETSDELNSAIKAWM